MLAIRPYFRFRGLEGNGVLTTGQYLYSSRVSTFFSGLFTKSDAAPPGQLTSNGRSASPFVLAELASEAAAFPRGIAELALRYSGNFAHPRIRHPPLYTHLSKFPFR